VVLQEVLTAAGLHAFLQLYSTGGLLGIYTKDPADLGKAASVLKEAAVGTFTSSSFDSIKNKSALKRMLALEGDVPGSTAALLVEAHISGGGLSAEKFADVRSVSLGSVTAAAAAALKALPAYAVLGATSSAPTFEAVTKLLR
jgi:hypothetical protein